MNNTHVMAKPGLGAGSSLDQEDQPFELLAGRVGPTLFAHPEAAG
jgi:hypothetical protein